MRRRLYASMVAKVYGVRPSTVRRWWGRGWLKSRMDPDGRRYSFAVDLDAMDRADESRAQPRTAEHRPPSEAASPRGT